MFSYDRQMNSLTLIEQERYARHFSLPEIGIRGQQRLQQSKVLCVGAGGLGSSALFYLAGAGVGTLGIIDADQIELSNLQRQILFTTADIGKYKVEIASQRLLALNPNLNIQSYAYQLTDENALEIMSQYDIILDATDNYHTRYLINDASFHVKKPYIFASISRFSGQCSVFATAHGPCYRCLFPTLPTENYLPNCTADGVIGAVPGILGSLQAIETIKLITQIGNSLIGRVLTVDTLNMRWNEISLSRNPECLLCAKQTLFTKLPRPMPTCKTKKEIEITWLEFKKLSDKKSDFFLLDVREPKEYEQRNIQGYLIPLRELPQRLQELNPKKKIIVHCETGMRANQAALFLQKNGFHHVRSLTGDWHEK